MSNKTNDNEAHREFGIPPLFSTDFINAGPSWERVTGIDAELVGRVLTCHLILEHYLTKLIEFETPHSFDWEGSRISFSQKMHLVKRLSLLKETNLIKGIEIINKIRNMFSHNLDARIDVNDQIRLVTILNKFYKFLNKDGKQFIPVTAPNAIGAIENFTNSCCAFIAGYCTSLVMMNKKKSSEKE